ncbi:MAG: alpha/beta hydrolase [Nodosilinea sp.]
MGYPPTGSKSTHRALARPRRWVSALLGIGVALVTPAPVNAAEEIFFQYGSLIRSVQVSSLETLASEGVVVDDLAFYIKLVGLSEAELEQFRGGLSRTLPIDGVLLSRFLYSNLGEDLLTRLGEILRLRGGSNGKPALRAALINAALSAEGLSAINVVHHLPTDMQISVPEVLAVDTAVAGVVTATSDAVNQLGQLTTDQAAKEPEIDYSTLPDLTQPGPFAVQSQRLNLTDAQRSRQFYVDITRPQQWGSGLAPVMVFSHGLSASPESRRDWASHLASYGIVVVMPQHPGSDAGQIANFRAGLSSEIFDIQEFIDRPLDISFVLDELERRNQREFDGRLDLVQVGAGGHSLGGYTALAVAGGAINFPYLEQACNQRFIHINVSLLLQCQALRLPRQTYRFRDPRVTSILISNPVNSSIFGPEGLAPITIPVLVMAGSYDPATPAVFEQFRTFPWFTTENRALALIEGQAHIDLSALDAGVSNLIAKIPGLTLPPPDVIDRYFNAISLAYVGRYVAQRPDYRVYLRAAYANYLSQGETFSLFMVNAGADVDQGLIAPLNERLRPLEQPTRPPAPVAE